MKSTRALAGAMLAALVLVAHHDSAAQRYVEATEPAFPRLKYADSLVSANDRCIVSRAKLNPKMSPIYVNGVPIGFC